MSDQFYAWRSGRRASARWMSWSSRTALIAACFAVVPSAVVAQSTAPDAPPASLASSDGAPTNNPDSQEIVVTGTSIRGIAPVGSNLMSVGQDAIRATAAQTVKDILVTLPSVSGAGQLSQGQNNSNYYAPSIHQLGGSASNSTLVIMDGMRLPQGGVSHSQIDPNLIPPDAIERVEIIPDGASSIYGSDAVAGVINFITRKHFDGLQVTAQGGFADAGYKRYSAGLMWGTHWDTGSTLVAYGYSHQGSLDSDAHSFLDSDHRDEGGSNFNSFNCSPATIQPTGSSLIYLSPTSASGVANTTANASCNTAAYGQLIPSETRHRILARVEQEVGENLTIDMDMIYATRRDHRDLSRGTVTATVFQTGAQANPFYVNPPGVTATSQTIRFDANDLLGPGAYQNDGATTFLANASARYKLGSNFVVTLTGVVGRDHSYQNVEGQICGSCANLALNGTTNTSGSTTAVSVPGTNIVVLGLPLTTANALDVWNVGAANRTSAAVLHTLTINSNITTADNKFQQVRLGTDGKLFKLPGGDVRVAFGGEMVRYQLSQYTFKPNNTGPSTLGSATNVYNFKRNVYSAYGEIVVPIIGPDNHIPLIQSLTADVSGRYDHYSDVGTTKNPKYALNWEITDGIKIRGNYSTSFVAPQLDSIGDPNQNYNAAYSHVNTYSGQINLPTANYPGIAGVLPGCAVGAVTCAVGTSTVQGIDEQRGGGAELKPQTGKGWSIGGDFRTHLLPGLRASVTYFNNKFNGGVTSPTASAQVNVPDLNYLIQVFPTGATAAQIAALTNGVPVTGSLPQKVYFIRNDDQRNVLNLNVSGLDIDISYEFNTGIGHFVIGDAVTHFTKYMESFGATGTSFSVIDETGFNTTFPAIKTQMRAHFGWNLAGITADVFANYTGSYHNWSASTLAPLTVDSSGNPTGGGDKVKSQTLIDLHLAYEFSGGFLNGDQVFVQASNLFDRDPRFYNTAVGYDTFVANPLGRVITFGLRAKF